jgi:hypothetical protein
LLVLVALEVHEPTDRRVSVRRDLDEVQLTGSSDREGLGKRFHAELFAAVADEANLAGPDAVVDPGVVCGYEVTSKVPGRE